MRVPENPPNPPWAYVGANIVHSKFGPGTITHVGPYKGVDAVSVQFDGHEKALEIEHALPHVRWRTRSQRRAFGGSFAASRREPSRDAEVPFGVTAPWRAR